MFALGAARKVLPSDSLSMYNDSFKTHEEADENED